MPAPEQQNETAGAPGTDTPAPSPSQDTAKPPRGRRFEAKDDEAELRAKVAEQASELAALKAKVAEQAEALQRLAEALGRADAILPVATPDQIRAAHDAGQRLKVISSISRGGLVLQAGRVIEARHYRIDTLVDLASVGLLRVAVLPKAA